MRSQRHQHARSTWGSIRRFENGTREHLRRRHILWLHGWCIGLAVLLVMWGVAHLQMASGSAPLAVRYVVTLGAGYLVFLGILRWWAGVLVGEQGGGDVGVDLPDVQLRGGDGQATSHASGGGGDFGGGGAQASFDLPQDASAVTDVAGTALEAAGSADEGAIVVVPVVMVFLAGMLVLFGFGWLMLLYFGWEVLLAVAVEVAFGYLTGRTAVRLAREGWLGAAVRLTWKPLLGALVCAVLLGALIDHFVPQARSLPDAVRILKAH